MIAHRQYYCYKMVEPQSNAVDPVCTVVTKYYITQTHKEQVSISVTYIALRSFAVSPITPKQGSILITIAIVATRVIQRFILWSFLDDLD